MLNFNPAHLKNATETLMVLVGMLSVGIIIGLLSNLLWLAAAFALLLGGIAFGALFVLYQLAKQFSPTPEQIEQAMELAATLLGNLGGQIGNKDRR